VSNGKILSELNDNFFPFYSTILQSIRQVFDNNLPQKVQDQLVLIEEVFDILDILDHMDPRSGISKNGGIRLAASLTKINPKGEKRYAMKRYQAPQEDCHIDYAR
jgi:hypothetical protein